MKTKLFILLVLFPAFGCKITRIEYPMGTNTIRASDTRLFMRQSISFAQGSNGLTLHIDSGADGSFAESIGKGVVEGLKIAH